MLCELPDPAPPPPDTRGLSGTLGAGGGWVNSLAVRPAFGVGGVGGPAGVGGGMSAP